MNFKSLTIAALAASTIALASAGSAQASQQHHGPGVSELVQLVHGKRFKRHFHGKHFGWGYWHHGCGFYFKKAKWTGSYYWWKKYKRCVHGWY